MFSEICISELLDCHQDTIISMFYSLIFPPSHSPISSAPPRELRHSLSPIPRTQHHHNPSPFPQPHNPSPHLPNTPSPPTIQSIAPTPAPSPALPQQPQFTVILGTPQRVISKISSTQRTCSENIPQFFSFLDLEVETTWTGAHFC